MKKLIAIAVVMAFTGAAVLAQTPDVVKEKFRKDNPDAMGMVWKSEKDNTFRVTYTENKVDRAMVYDNNGNLVSRQTIVKDASIPAGVKDYYAKRITNTNEYAPSYTVWQTTDKNGNVSYYSEYNGKPAYFDKDGKVITRQGVAEGETEKQDEKMPEEKK